jgi:2-aminoethylphosphonate transport system ATP-binding protein
MLDELAKLHRDLPNLTVLYVTHDQSEALTLANHIGIMRDGKLKAFGGSQSLFRHPPNRFAAEFLGRANLLPVTDVQPLDEQMAKVRFGNVTLSARNHHGLARGSDCLVCVRPHDFRFSRASEPNSISGTVLSVQWQGDVHNITFDAGGETMRMTSAPMANPPRIGETIAVHFDAAEVTLVPEDASHG